MGVANIAVRLACMLVCSSVASRIRSKPSTHIRAPSEEIPARDICDPRTTRLQAGDAYTVRSFMAKDMFGEKIGQFVNDVNIMGHQYIEILARDASAEAEPAKSCLATFGLFIWGEDVDIQSPDWGVAVNSKKISKCVKDGSTLEACVDEINDIMVPPLNLGSPDSPAIVARGKEQYRGSLSDTQKEVLSLVLRQAKPSTHDFLDKPVVKMSVRKGCQPGTIEPLIAPRHFFGWKCNCMTFTNRFRKDTAKLLLDLNHLVDLLESMKAPPTEDLTALFGDLDTIQRRDEAYDCCCTELNWKTYCKLVASGDGPSPSKKEKPNIKEFINNMIKDTRRRKQCSDLDELNFQFQSWNNAAKKNGNVTIENFGRCMVAADDPLLSKVRNSD